MTPVSPSGRGSPHVRRGSGGGTEAATLAGTSVATTTVAGAGPSVVTTVVGPPWRPGPRLVAVVVAGSSAASAIGVAATAGAGSPAGSTEALRAASSAPRATASV